LLEARGEKHVTPIKAFRAAALASTVVLFVAQSAWGDAVASDRLVISNPGGFSNRVLSDSGPVPTVETSPGGPLVFEPAEPIQTSVTILAFSSITDSVEQRLVLLEPDGTFSDDVFVAVSPAFEGSQRVGFALNSDSSGIVFFLPVDFTTTETGDLQDVTHFFTILNGSGLVVQVQSHLEPVATEPASLLLLACGVGGLGWGSMSPPREVASR
jgi:hypothetical protein